MVLTVLQVSTQNMALQALELDVEAWMGATLLTAPALFLKLVKMQGLVLVTV
jgi:hypothetical protein